MEKIKLNLLNCYGINKLEHEFDFTNNKSTQLIYSPNGIMKTSLANTLDDYSKNIESKDRITPSLETSREILDETSAPIPQEEIFVIKSYEQSFKPTMVSTLLVNEDLKQQYVSITEKINSEIEKLVVALNNCAGIRKDTVKKLCHAFDSNENNFIELLAQLSTTIDQKENYGYGQFQYNKIFDPKIVTLITTPEFQMHINDYIQKYDDLVSKSTLFKKEFNHYNATTIQKQLKDNGYFNANHSILLNLNGDKQEINNPTDLLRKIKEAQEEIFHDSTLKEIFDKIDKKLTNTQLREFRDLLLENKYLLTELADLKLFEQRVWISYLTDNINQYKLVIKEYTEGQEVIQKVLLKAKDERTEWEKVIEIFNSRFYVPYKLEIENKVDTIVKADAPSIKYYFNNQSESVEEELLWRVLSQGERRTLYLLNIIFEIESRKSKGIKTVLVVDDIADSFDYKNKYAIVEYLKDISTYEDFNLIILTHNFDFMRTVQDRISSGSSKFQGTFIAIKEEDSIVLEKIKYGYISNPLKNWKDNLADESKLIASITFARNLAEYIGDTNSFNKLTSLLHLKNETHILTVNDIEIMYKAIFKDMDDLNLPNKDEKLFNIIMKVAKEITTTGIQDVNLENKVVLSIAIRLLAEEFMIRKINNPTLISSIRKNQTGELLKNYKILPDISRNSLEILERVNIMTPENIHLNSFMFEPILDLSNYHLIRLFNDVSSLIEELEPISV